MAVALITPPPILTFSADLIRASFLCTGFITSSNVKSVNELDCSVDVPHAVSFLYGNISVSMIGPPGAPDFDESGTVYSSSSVNNAIIGFKSNPDLSRDYDITISGDKIVFTAKVPGPSFDFIGLSSATNVVSGQSQVKKPNYTVLFKLYLENADNTGYENIYTTNLQLLPGTNGIAEAMIGDKLHVAMNKAIRDRLPEQPNNNIIQCKTSCRRYYFEFAESYGSPIVVQSINQSPVFTVISGGLSTLASSQTTVLGLIAPGAEIDDRFLRQGSNVVTRTNQPQYLYFINTRASRTVSLKTDFTFTDGTTIQETLGGIVLESMRKYAFDTSFHFLYSTPVANKIVKSYTVYLSYNGNRITEQKKFVIDYSPRNYIRYFLNWSSFGALDSRCFYGTAESSYELTSQSANLVPQYNQSLQRGHSLVFDSRLTRTFKVATGWLTEEALRGNADFFLSNIKYRFSNGKNLPIAIVPGKILEKTDGENLMAQTFEYKYLFDDHAYTEGDEEQIGMSIPDISGPNSTSWNDANNWNDNNNWSEQ